MSETVHYKGTLIEIPRLESETLEEQCKRLLNFEVLESYYESYQKKFSDKYYKEFVIYNHKIYQVSKENVDPDFDIFQMHKDQNGVLHFEENTTVVAVGLMKL